MTSAQFEALIHAPQTARRVKEAREALAKGDKNTYDRIKKSLPFVIFIATYEESLSIKNKKLGQWRKQQYCRLNGLCVIDFDHIEGDPREVWAAAYEKLSEEDKKRILFVFVTPSGQGLKVVFIADVAVGNLIDNQKEFSEKLGLNPDEACKDASRGSFLTASDDIILIDEERLINYENEAFGQKYNAEYHAGKSQPTKKGNEELRMKSEESGLKSEEPLTYHGAPYSKIVEAWLGGKKIEPGDRHRTSLLLADHLRYITDNDGALIEKILRQTPFVNEIVQERNEDVAQTVRSAQGYDFLRGIPKRM